jgi:hypothetical protein
MMDDENSIVDYLKAQGLPSDMASRKIIWHNVIDEYHVEDMHTSHIVEPDGIRNSKPAPELG